MPTLYQRNGMWYLNWREGGRRFRRSLGAIGEHDAETVRQAKALELRTGQRYLSDSLAFRDFAVTYLGWHLSEYPDSNDRTTYILDSVFQRFHDRPLDGISTFDIEQWKVERLTQVAKQTVLKELRTLSAMYEKAVLWGAVQANPIKAVTKPKAKSGKPPAWYDKAQLQALYRVSAERADWWRFIANTGLRRSEAIHAHRDHIKGGVLYVLSEEGRRTKSGKWRQIPLSTGALQALGGLGGDFLLPPMDKRSLTRLFRQDARKAALSGTLHALRHTFGAHLASSGVPLRDIQALMGHATIRTTEIYAHLAPENLGAAVTRLAL